MRKSIFLVGARGTGKSSLAVIAQTYLGLRHIEVEDLLREQLGSDSVSQQELLRGSYKPTEATINTLKNILWTHAEGYAIVWPAGLFEENSLLLLRRYASTHPVIHITRSATSVQQYLDVSDVSKLKLLMDLANRIYRIYSNFEFHNLAEEELLSSWPDQHTNLDMYRTISPRSLRLKHLEQGFVRFLVSAVNFERHDLDRGDGLLVPPCRSPFTYLLLLPLEQVYQKGFRVQWLNCGADACQLEIDSHQSIQSRHGVGLLDKISRAVAMIRRYFDGPLIYHVKRPCSPGFDHNYVHLVHHGMRLGVDYVTIDLVLPKNQISQLSSYLGHTRIVGVFHDDSPGSDGWAKPERIAKYQLCQELGFTGVRITQEAQSIMDNSAAVAFQVAVNRLPNPKPFLMAYNLGALGRPSRHLNRTLTPVNTEELQLCDSQNSCSGTGQIDVTIRTSQAALFSLSIWDPMQFYIIGVDVAYSLSPAIHSAAFEFFSMPHTFQARCISSLDELGGQLQNEHLGGISIAQGYKLDILSNVRSMSVHARNIGAINTLIPSRFLFNGKSPPAKFWDERCRAGPIAQLYGENTDWVGMYRCILPNLSPANAITAETAALVIGAGGMARAALYALMQLGVEHVAIYNRTVSHAFSLAQYFNSLKVDSVSPSYFDLLTHSTKTFFNVNKRAEMTFKVRVLESLTSDWPAGIAPPTIIISCIPASRIHNEPGSNFTLPQNWMSSPTGGVVLDLNYRPILTPLLRQVRRHVHGGWVAVDGLENLAAQASAQFELFTGRRPPQGLMRTAALRNYGGIGDKDEEAQEVVRERLTQTDAHV